MAVKAGDLEHDLIESLGQTVGRQLADAAPESYQEFVRQYYHWVPAKDLADRDQADLCGAVVAHWRTARRRARGEAKVNVYNPQRERDGWTSPYTVVEIVSDDMPFIVDSVTMELSRQGANIELIVHPVMRVVRDQEGELTQVLEPGGVAFGFFTESVIHAEVAYEPDPERLSVLRAGVELVLEEVRAAVEDWAEMRAKTTALATELRRQAPPAGPHELGRDPGLPLVAGRRELHLPRLPRVRAEPGGGVGRAERRRGVGPGHPARSVADAVPDPLRQGPRPGPLGASAGADQGQLARHRASARPTWTTSASSSSPPTAPSWASGASSACTRRRPTRPARATSPSCATRSSACSTMLPSRLTATTPRV